MLDDYVERDQGAAALVADGFDPALVERVLRLVDAAEYKRRQYPPGPKISFKAFGRDRRLPITNRWRESSAGREGRRATGVDAARRQHVSPSLGVADRLAAADCIRFR